MKLVQWSEIFESLKSFWMVSFVLIFRRKIQTLEISLSLSCYLLFMRLSEKFSWEKYAEVKWKLQTLYQFFVERQHSFLLPWKYSKISFEFYHSSLGIFSQWKKEFTEIVVTIHSAKIIVQIPMVCDWYRICYEKNSITYRQLLNFAQCVERKWVIFLLFHHFISSNTKIR